LPSALGDQADADPPKRFTFPRARRIRSPLDFQRVRTQGRRIFTQSLIFWVLKCPTGPRLGLSVSRKIGGSVVRNRVKRLLRESFRRMQWELPALDFVISPKRGITTWTLDTLFREWIVLIGQL
jgi:ribonuclease P protein component